MFEISIVIVTDLRSLLDAVLENALQNSSQTLESAYKSKLQNINDEIRKI